MCIIYSIYTPINQLLSIVKRTTLRRLSVCRQIMFRSVSRVCGGLSMNNDRVFVSV